MLLNFYRYLNLKTKSLLYMKLILSYVYKISMKIILMLTYCVLFISKFLHCSTKFLWLMITIPTFFYLKFYFTWYSCSLSLHTKVFRDGNPAKKSADSDSGFYCKFFCIADSDSRFQIRIPILIT